MIQVVKRLIAPLLIYFVLFFLFSTHLIGQFSSYFFLDGGDGFQNVWNLWWVNHSVTQLGKSPWFTDYLHFPYGTSLLGQTLNPFNGFMGIGLQRFLTLVQTVNSIVVFSFVFSGLTAFLLCAELTGSYWGSLFGGAVFTFSNYHFMHAEGHMQLISMEWIPLFILLWRKLIRTPRLDLAFYSALTLFFVLLCDYYYFFYCVMTGAFLLFWEGKNKKKSFYFLSPTHRLSLITFVVLSLFSSGGLVFQLLLQNSRDPLLGAHSSREFSMDLLSPFIPGFHWYFRKFTQGVWSQLSGGGNETSVYLGWSVLLLGIYAWSQRRKFSGKDLKLWASLAVVFFILSFGPFLHVMGDEVRLGPSFQLMGKTNLNFLLLPYGFLWLVFPPLRLSGCPIRMMVMVQLFLGIFAAFGLQLILDKKTQWKYLIIGILLSVFFVEYYPYPIPLTDPALPNYVNILKSLPEGAVLDQVSTIPSALYFQTVHQKKMAFGYISRTPTSVDIKDRELIETIDRGDWNSIFNQFKFQYIVTRQDLKLENLQVPLERISAGDGIMIYGKKSSIEPKPLEAL